MRFTLEVRQGRSSALEFASVLEAEIARQGGRVVAEEDDPEMVLAVGGDGTMLAAVQVAMRRDVPVLGFNLGTIGFLTEAEPGEVATVVGSLLAGNFQIDERMTVSATVKGRTGSGVNDVVVEKVDSQRLIDLDVAIDGTRFVNYRVDGLIIATPTGSTAYSFSAGGPLVDPGLDALILAPVAAHSLFDRTLVIPPTSFIDITVGRDRPVKVSVDKLDLGLIGAGDLVAVRQGEAPVRFVTFGGRSFAALLTEKFELG